MNSEISKTDQAKKFVVDHKVAITVVATSLLWYAINRHALRQHDNFLAQKGLYTEYYELNEED